MATTIIIQDQTSVHVVPYPVTNIVVYLYFSYCPNDFLSIKRII